MTQGAHTLARTEGGCPASAARSCAIVSAVARLRAHAAEDAGVAPLEPDDSAAHLRLLGHDVVDCALLERQRVSSALPNVPAVAAAEWEESVRSCLYIRLLFGWEAGPPEAPLLRPWADELEDARVREIVVDDDCTQSGGGVSVIAMNCSERGVDKCPARRIPSQLPNSRAPFSVR